MNDDELRRRITASDPMTSPDVPIQSVHEPGARALLEEIMSTPTITENGSAPAAPEPERPDRKRWYAPIVGIAAAGALVLGGLTVGGAFDTADGDDEPEVADVADDVTDEPTAPSGSDEPEVVLSLGEGQDAMASCLRLEPDLLRPVPLAFAGDVTSIDGELVNLEVTQWYVGGDAPSVQLVAPAGLEALIGTVDFEVGGSYLISSGDGETVNYCGWSGPATPELQSIYDAAFTG